MKHVTLPVSLKPVSCNRLIRLGRNNDGGYVVCSNAIQSSSCLLSLGINDDWSFEESYLKKNKKPVVAYDGSISENIFKKRFFKSLLSGYQAKNALRLFRVWRSFKKFIAKVTFHESFVGIRGFEKYISLSEALAQLHLPDGIFIKMDIEGFEYRLLQEIIDNKSRFVGAAIEFHDVDLNIEKIEKFIEDFDQDIVYLNINNFSPINGSGIPLTIEVCFSAVSCHGVGKHWSRFIQPNNPHGYEYCISFNDEKKR